MTCNANGLVGSWHGNDLNQSHFCNGSFWQCKECLVDGGSKED